MSKSDEMRHLIDLANGNSKPIVAENEDRGSAEANFARWSLAEKEEKKKADPDLEEDQADSLIGEGVWGGEPAADSVNVYQDKDPLGTGQWFWSRSHNGHTIGSGSCSTEAEANDHAYGPVSSPDTLDEVAGSAVHLLRPRGGSECGAPVDGDEDNFTAEINDVTCPACLKGHEEYMSQFEHNDAGDAPIEEEDELDRMYQDHLKALGGFNYHVDRNLEEEDDGWKCPNCGNTDQDGGDHCVDCGAPIEDEHDAEGSAPIGVESDTVTGPAAWASYLINGDASGMSPEDLAACEEWQRNIEPYYVVSMCEDEPHFTWSYRLHGGTSEGGDVVDYIVHKHGGASMETEADEDMKFVVKLTDPKGEVFYAGHHGPVADPSEAFKYNNARAAATGASYYYGTNPAFWGSERDSAKSMAQKYRGWKAEAVPMEASPIEEGKFGNAIRKGVLGAAATIPFIAGAASGAYAGSSDYNATHHKPAVSSQQHSAVNESAVNEGPVGRALKVAAGAIAGAALAIPAAQIAKNAVDYGRGGGFSSTNSVSPMSMDDAKLNNAWHDAAAAVEKADKPVDEAANPEGYKQQDGTILPYGVWHKVSPKISIMPKKSTFYIRFDPTGEVVKPAGPSARDALMMALYKNEEPTGYAYFCFGGEAMKAPDVEQTEEAVMEDGGGIHVSSYLDIDQLPEECIEDCSSSGDVSQAVEYWRQKLNFTVDRKRAIQCLTGYGSWEPEELEQDDDDKLADRILWLACCNFNEWDGNEDGESASGSPQFYLE